MRADPVSTDEPCELCQEVVSALLVSGNGLNADCQPWIGALGCQRFMVCDDCLPKIYEPVRTTDRHLTTEDVEWLE